jgi:hypothetical protein
MTANVTHVLEGKTYTWTTGLHPAAVSMSFLGVADQTIISILGDNRIKW